MVVEEVMRLDVVFFFVPVGEVVDTLDAAHRAVRHLCEAPWAEAVGVVAGLPDVGEHVVANAVATLVADVETLV